MKGVKAIAFDIEQVHARPAKAQYETLVTLLADRRADAVVADPLFLGAAFMLEHQWTGGGRRIRSERPSARAMRRDILAVPNQSRYREASQRIAADMVAAPGFAGLAGVVDRLVATSTPAASAGPTA